MGEGESAVAAWAPGEGGDARVEGVDRDGGERSAERTTEEGEVLLCVDLVDDGCFFEALTSRGEFFA